MKLVCQSQFRINHVSHLKIFQKYLMFLLTQFPSNQINVQGLKSKLMGRIFLFLNLDHILAITFNDTRHVFIVKKCKYTLLKLVFLENTQIPCKIPIRFMFSLSCSFSVLKFLGTVLFNEQL